MNGTTCAKVRKWVREALRTGQRSRDVAEHVHYIAGCPSCRDAVSLMAGQVLQRPIEANAVDCRQCLEDLPAFIDQELADPVAAMYAFPSVWCHLWICPICAETYLLTLELLQQ